MDIKDLKCFVELIDKIHISLNSKTIKEPIETEEISRLNARRSIVTVKDLPKNHLIQEGDLTYKRPGTGISPLYWDEVIGRIIDKDLEKDHILTWSDLA